jgi:hypothetical protein
VTLFECPKKSSDYAYEGDLGLLRESHYFKIYPGMQKESLGMQKKHTLDA